MNFHSHIIYNFARKKSRQEIMCGVATRLFTLWMLGQIVLLSMAATRRTLTNHQEVKRPYGLHMCHGICQRVVGCQTYTYTVGDLRCECTTSGQSIKQHIHKVLKVDYGLVGCPTQSIVISTRAKSFHCLKNVKKERNAPYYKKEMKTSRKNKLKYTRRASPTECPVFFAAIIKGKLDQIKDMTAQEVDYKYCTSGYNQNSILHAAKNGRVEIINYLIELGHDVHATTQSQNALHFAARYGRPGVVKQLLGILDLESKDNKERTPCMLAAFHRHLKILIYLIDKGCNVRVRDRDNNNMLHYACSRGHDLSFFNNLFHLIQFKIDINLPGKDGLTCQKMAERTGNRRFISHVRNTIRHKVTK